MKDKIIQDPNYNGKYVAVLQAPSSAVTRVGRKLAKNVYEGHSYIPIYIDNVSLMRRCIKVSSSNEASFIRVMKTVNYR